MMTDNVDHRSFMQLAYRKMYPNADEFPERYTRDVFKDFIPVFGHPALSPTFTRAINGVVYYAGMPMVASSQENDFTWTKRPVPSDALKGLAEFMDLRTNGQKVFTNLHENVCDLLGVEKNFSKLEAVNPYVSTDYTFPQTTLTDLKRSFKQVKLNKEK